MWQSVELRELRLYLALAEELHFGRTATKLGVTQSRVSQSLADVQEADEVIALACLGFVSRRPAGIGGHGSGPGR
jgi:hypothetical protein